MVPTTKWISEKFDVFNNMYFGGRLRKCKFTVSSSRTAWGMCCWKYKAGSVRTVRAGRRFRPVLPGSECIKISKFFDADEHHLEETLIHEMIHLLFVQADKAYVKHGSEFLAEARRITREGTHKISVTDSAEFAVNDEIRKARKRVFRVVVLRNKRDKSLWYMTSAPGMDRKKLDSYVSTAIKTFPKYEVAGSCVSDHDMFVGRQATIKPSGRWSIYMFPSESAALDMWSKASDKSSAVSLKALKN